MKRPIGERLKSIRETRKLSQKDMAELIEMSPRYYQAVEGGEKNPTFNRVVLAARRLNMTFAELAEEPARTAESVADMTPVELEALITKASKRDGSINLEIERLKKRLSLIPGEVIDSWTESSTANKALCMYFFDWQRCVFRRSSDERPSICENDSSSSGQETWLSSPRTRAKAIFKKSTAVLFRSTIYVPQASLRNER